MSITKTHCFRLFSGLALMFACSGEAANSAPLPGDENPSSDNVDLDVEASTLSQSLVASDTARVRDEPAYFSLRRDLRRCAAPRCGGFFVSRVNRVSTVCADGSRSDECYVSDLDFSALGLSPRQVAAVEDEAADFVLRGEIVAERTPLGRLGRLSVTEAWQGHADVEPSGAFLRVVNEGIVCITSPCLSFSAELLNSRRGEVPVAEIGLDRITSNIDDALAQLNEPDGLLVAARRTVVRGPGGRALGLAASEYFIPLTAEAAACGSRGLSQCADDEFCSFPAGANCGRADAPGVCAPRPEVCTFLYKPVCGCDGQTYGNACTAAGAGVSVEFEGECNAASD